RSGDKDLGDQRTGSTAKSGHLTPALTSAEPDDGTPVAWATMQVEPGRPTGLQVTGRTRDPAITTALARIAGHTPQTSGYGGDWTLWTVELPRGAIGGTPLPRSRRPDSRWGR